MDLKAQQAREQDSAIDRAKSQSSADDKNEPAANDDSHKVAADKTKKSFPRNRELERLGAVAPVSDSRRRPPTKSADNDKMSKNLPNSHVCDSEDGKSSASVTDADESVTSETDVDLTSVSEEDVYDDSDTEEAISDNDSEVIIVSEVKGSSGAGNSSKSVEKKSVSARGSSVAFKKPSEHVVTQSRSSSSSSLTPSSLWVNRVSHLESAMAEMKAKFAEVLRQKVSVDAAMLVISK